MNHIQYNSTIRVVFNTTISACRRFFYLPSFSFPTSLLLAHLQEKRNGFSIALHGMKTLDHTDMEDEELQQRKMLHPPKRTCLLKRDYFNRKYIFQPLIFRGHSLVFRGGKFTINLPNIQSTPQTPTPNLQFGKLMPLSIFCC